MIWLDKNMLALLLGNNLPWYQHFSFPFHCLILCSFKFVLSSCCLWKWQQIYLCHQQQENLPGPGQQVASENETQFGPKVFPFVHTQFDCLVFVVLEKLSFTSPHSHPKM